LSVWKACTSSGEKLRMIFWPTDEFSTLLTEFWFHTPAFDAPASYTERASAPSISARACAAAC
jgi:hypothetical protein